VITLFLYQTGFSQAIPGEDRGDLRIMFYNVENLFDTTDDPSAQDDEFLPEGERHWTPMRYWNKINHLYKVVVALGGWRPPEIIGLCEVENRGVLEDLLKKTPLARYNYRIVHQDSPDERGIDVALLFLNEYLTVLSTRYIPVTIAGEPEWKTRDILYLAGMTAPGDTLHLFVNHWPSRSGGQLETEHYRLEAARILRQEIERIFADHPESNVIVMGDFNDNPGDQSIQDVLGVEREMSPVRHEMLYNLSRNQEDQKVAGSYKYQMSWDLMDQIIVSGKLLCEDEDLYVKRDGFRIFSPDFLLEEDKTNMGVKPFRTYSGFRYQNGFSDHLPVFIDLWEQIPGK
jgi:predicted extracellular nuclease